MCLLATFYIISITPLPIEVIYSIAGYLSKAIYFILPRFEFCCEGSTPIFNVWASEMRRCRYQKTFSLLVICVSFAIVLMLNLLFEEYPRLLCLNLHALKF